jgi:hypothetical protein
MRRKKMKRDGAENREKCRVLGMKGLSVRAISKRTKLNDDTVRLHLRALGIKPPKDQREGPLANRKQVTALVERRGVAWVADRFRVSRQAVYARLAKWEAS